MRATYTSCFDDGDVVCESDCEYDPDTLTVSDIEPADNAYEADDTNSLTDEYVTLPDGTVLREADGVIFDY